jgi:putative Ca2+/H+ antiporter (TMEM165/GDT1 family)
MDKQLFLTVFSTVFVAEIGDKTQLATLLYAAERRGEKWTVFLGSAAALCAAAAIGVAAGEAVGRFVSPRTLRWIAGLGFIAVGCWTLARN